MVPSDYSGVAFLFPFLNGGVCVHASMHDSCFHYVYVCVTLLEPSGVCGFSPAIRRFLGGIG